MNKDPKIEQSTLSQEISSGGITVKVEIYRLEGGSSWELEVVDENNNSTVWDNTFETESAALIEAKKIILSGGIKALVGPKDGETI